MGTLNKPKRKFYNNLMQKWLSDNNVLMYQTYREGKLVVAERFRRTLKGKLYQKRQLMMVNHILVI